MPDPILEFGPFRFDPEARLLSRGDVPLPLTPKAFDTLTVLIEARQRVVEKAELMQRLWPDAVVEEANLTQQIFTLRKALGDSADGSLYIRTVPRRGYRFVADVRLALADAKPAAEPRAAKRTPWRRILAVAVTLAALGGGIAVWSKSPAPLAAATVAVLPWANTSSPPGEDYLAHGLTEGLIRELGSVPALRVLGPSTAFGSSGSHVEPRAAGRALNADMVLTGEVAQRAQRVEIHAVLIAVADGIRLWDRRYAVDLGSLPRLQRTIRDEVARRLARSTSGSSAERSRVVDEEAYRLCLQGRYFWSKRTEEGIRRSIADFRQALQRDPNYAEAWSGMADAYNVLPEYSETSEAEAYPAAKHAATQALALDPEQAEAHASLAFVLYWWDHDAPRAEQEFRRALELNPNYATAHHWYGNALLAMRRIDDAVMQLEEAHRADPLSLIIGAERGAVLYHARRFDDAVVVLRRTVELDPRFPEARFWLARTLIAQGQAAAALEECRLAQELYTDPSTMLAEMGLAHARSGRMADAREDLRRLEAFDRDRPVAHSLAVLLAGLGERDQALAALERGLRQRASDLAFLGTDPAFDSLRGDPRFESLLEQLRYPRSPP